MRDKIYYLDFTNKRNTNYRLEMLPVSEDALRNTNYLALNPTRQSLPDDIISTDQLTNEAAFDKLPFSFAPIADITLEFKFKKGVAAHDAIRSLISHPLLTGVTQNPLYDGLPAKRLNGGYVRTPALGDGNYFYETESWELPPDPVEGASYLYDIMYEVRTTSPDVILVVEETTYPDPQPYQYMQFWLNTSSPEAAFSITIHRKYANYQSGAWVVGSFTPYEHKSFVYGNPLGYEDIALPQSSRNGNTWRLIRMNSDFTAEQETVFYGAQKRIPSTAITETPYVYECKIEISDMYRAAIEKNNTPSINTKLPASPRLTATTLYSNSTNTATLEYKLRTGHEYRMFYISDLYASINALTRISFADIVRYADAECTLQTPATLKFYNHNTSSSTPLPEAGIALADMLFTATIFGNSTHYAGVLSVKEHKAEESWDDAYSSIYDLLTDLCTNFLAKQRIKYNSRTSITVESLPMFAQLTGQDSVTLTTADFMEQEITYELGANSIRGCNTETEMPHDDDLKEVKMWAAASEREEELAPKVLLHNIPSYTTDLHPTLLQIKDGSNNVAPTEVVRIETGLTSIYPLPRLYDYADTTITRDVLITNLQYERGLANAINRALVALYSSAALVTIKGTILTRTNLHAGRVGAIVTVQLTAFVGTISCVLLSCHDNISEGTSEVELLGLLPIA